LHPASLWGVLGFIALLVSAVYRLLPLALEPIRAGTLSAWGWFWYGVSIVFNFYAEGFRGFHLQASPRTIARAQALSDRRFAKYWFAAPLFCMGLVCATRKRLLVSWCLYVGIVILVIIVRQIPQPYRGIIDAGVCVGLTAGMVSILYFFVRAVRGHDPGMSPDLPETRG
jgi:hypothetical protein